MPKIRHLKEPEKLLLTWQDPIGRKRYVVGEVTRSSENDVRFRYLPDRDLARAERAGFEGYPAFPISDREYTGGVLASFASRLPPQGREDYGQYLEYWFIDATERPSIFTLLGYTGAALARDGFRFFPVFWGEGDFDFVMEVAGYRYHAKGVTPEVGEPVAFSPEPENEHDPHAVAVWVRRDGARRRLGYVMRGLNEPFADWLARGEVTGEVTGEVARINGTGERTLVLVYVNVHIPSEVPVAAG